jgi:hypothetical protein
MTNNKLIVAGVLGLTAMASVAPAAFADGRDFDRGNAPQYRSQERGGFRREDRRDDRFDARAPRYVAPVRGFDRDNYRYSRFDGRRDGDGDGAAAGLIAGLVLGALVSR